MGVNHNKLRYYAPPLGSGNHWSPGTGLLAVALLHMSRCLLYVYKTGQKNNYQMLAAGITLSPIVLAGPTGVSGGR